MRRLYILIAVMLLMGTWGCNRIDKTKAPKCSSSDVVSELKKETLSRIKCIVQAYCCLKCYKDYIKLFPEDSRPTFKQAIKMSNAYLAIIPSAAGLAALFGGNLANPSPTIDNYINKNCVPKYMDDIKLSVGDIIPQEKNDAIRRSICSAKVTVAYIGPDKKFIKFFRSVQLNRFPDWIEKGPSTAVIRAKYIAQYDEQGKLHFDLDAW